MKNGSFLAFQTESLTPHAILRKMLGSEALQIFMCLKFSAIFIQPSFIGTSEDDCGLFSCNSVAYLILESLDFSLAVSSKKILVTLFF